MTVRIMSAIFFFFSLYACTSEKEILTIEQRCYFIKIEGHSIESAGKKFPVTYALRENGILLKSEEPIFRAETSASLVENCAACDEGFTTTLTLLSEYEIYLASEIVYSCRAVCKEDPRHFIELCL